MAVSFQNTEYKYLNSKKKPVYVPSKEGRNIGYKIKALVEENYKFDDFYMHFRPGGHILAMHEHRRHRFLAKIDLRNFFYSVGRNRVSKALKGCGVRNHVLFAKWSTVKDPFNQNGYVLPYGFIQSPILSSLVLSQSALGNSLRLFSKEVLVTVYIDDIAISSDDAGLLAETHDALIQKTAEAGFELNETKTFAPSDQMELFNCKIQAGHVEVLPSRRDEFYFTSRSTASVEGFERYCESVTVGNN